MSYSDWVAGSVEANYAGGTAGAAYAKAALAQPGLTIALPIPKGDLELPMVEYERKNIKAPGYGLLVVKTIIEKIKYNEPQWEFYYQTDDWYDLAVSGSIGGLPTSIALHYLKDTMSIDAWGVIVEEWELSSKAQEVVVEKVKPLFYDIDLTASVLTLVAYSTAAVRTMADCSFTVETVAQNVTDFSIKCKNTFEPGFVGGEHTRKLPYLKKREYTGSLTLFTSALIPTFAGYLNDPTNVTCLFDTVYTLGIMTLTIANAKILTLNVMTIPDTTEETAKYKYTLTWEMGEGFTCTKS